MAQGRASAWGGAPTVAAPVRGARGPGLSPRALRPQSRRRPQREQRPTRREPAPLSSGPRSVLGAGPRDCRRGVGQPVGAGGQPKHVSVGY